MVEKELINLSTTSKRQPHKSGNLTIEQKKALNELSANKTITIKQADKGGLIVVMNTTDYEKEAIRQLNDTDTYQPLSFNPANKFKKELENIANFGKQLGLVTDRRWESAVF